MSDAVTVPRLIEVASRRISFHWAGHLPDAQRPADQIPERGVRTSLIGNIEAPLGQVANARRKAKAQQVAEGKYMVRESCGVGVVSSILRSDSW